SVAAAPCKDTCAMPGCPNPGGHLPPCATPEHGTRTSDSGPCAPGLITIRPNGRRGPRLCCWPGQVASGNQCAGLPDHCPPGMMIGFGGCTEHCFINQQPSADGLRCELIPAAPGVLVIDSDLSGALVQNLSVLPSGFHLPKGQTRWEQAAGRVHVRLSFD